MKNRTEQLREKYDYLIGSDVDIVTSYKFPNSSQKTDAEKYEQRAVESIPSLAKQLDNIIETEFSGSYEKEKSSK